MCRISSLGAMRPMSSHLPQVMLCRKQPVIVVKVSITPCLGVSAHFLCIWFPEHLIFPDVRPDYLGSITACGRIFSDSPCRSPLAQQLVHFSSVVIIGRVCDSKPSPQGLKWLVDHFTNEEQVQETEPASGKAKSRTQASCSSYPLCTPPILLNALGWNCDDTWWIYGKALSCMSLRPLWTKIPLNAVLACLLQNVPVKGTWDSCRSTWQDGLSSLLLFHTHLKLQSQRRGCGEM